ncbi:branched-chain amino acid ABC transporter permease [Roseivivax sp. CAU 1761]
MIGLVSYLVFFATVASILAIAVLGLNLQWGNTGLFNGGVAAFFGAGAYGTLILGGTPQAGHLGGFALPWPLALAGGMAAAAALAWVVGRLTLKLRHDYLAIATFGVAVAFENVMRNAEWLSGGAKGLRGFERPLQDVLGAGLLYNALYLAVVLAVLLATYLFLERLVRSPFGRLLRAIREDEEAARSLGKSPARVRLTAFITGSVIMGLAGGLYGSFYAFVSPQDVLPILTFQIWAMLIVGGAGNNRGAILGAVLIWGAWTASGWALARFAPVEAQIYAGSIQYILIGLVIVGMLLWRPQGLFPERLVVSQSSGAPRRITITNQAQTGSSPT